MSGGDAGYWRLDVVRPGVGLVPLKVAVRGRDVVEVQIGQSAPVALSTRQLAELVEDLRAAGRHLRGLESAQGLAREYRPRGGFGPLLSPEELDAALDDG